MTISGVGMMAGDPQLAVDMALLEQSHQDRDAARTERHAAQEEEQHELSAQVDSMREAAMAHLVGGLIQGGSQLAEGACTLHQAQMMLDQVPLEGQESSLRRQAEGAHGAAERASLINQADGVHSAIARLGAGETAMQGWGKVSEGIGSIGNTISTYIGASAEADAKEHERLAGVARERADDLRAHEQDASGRADRAIGRIDDAIRSRTQTFSSMVSNIRA